MKRNLTKSERLRGSKNFNRVFRNARKVDVKGLKILYLENGLEINRIAIIAGKSFGKAVKRNRVKRHLREAYRNMKYKIKMGFDIIIIPYDDNYSYRDRSLQLQLAFERGDMLS